MTELQNRLLASLPSDTRERVLAVAQRVDMGFKQTVAEPDRLIEHVYFPESGVISVVMCGEDAHAMVEVATVGREGMVNLPVLLESDASPASVFCQIPGSAVRVGAADLSELTASDPELRRTLLRYAQATITQIAQFTACNRLHSIPERAARWLLMTRDRVDADTFPLTQEFLGQMLGVRRQAVNIAAGTLQKAGLITYSRGRVTIVDRSGLEEASCECYRIITREFDRLHGVTMARRELQPAGNGVSPCA
jgi:CRP-like cAMP-binding protein